MINEQSINRCWEEAMRYFLEHSYRTNMCGREYLVLDNLVIRAKDYICDTEVSDYCLWTKSSLEYYLKQLDNPGKFSEMSRLYAYGVTEVNQYDYAIKVLKKRKNIKPIVLPIYDPYKDNRENVPTPCISNIVLEQSNKVLNMHVNYSTMNLFRMGVLDFQQMAHLHKRFVADSHTQVGELRITIVKVHMPVFDYMVSKKLFSVGDIYG
ncbi:MAG TPA: hypothetical protein DCW90_14955 [Lachnospiraceae bacterium]|nr:hypothetical protein [uncultured Lachnoclostridium sp.]HAU86734.1 hypothetical protein [Lachnospiraceae bacterium]